MFTAEINVLLNLNIILILFFHVIMTKHCNFSHILRISHMQLLQQLALFLT